MAGKKKIINIDDWVTTLAELNRLMVKEKE